MPIRGRGPGRKDLGGLSRGDRVTVEYMTRGNDKKQRSAKVKRVQQGRRGKVKVKTDIGALVAGPGESPRISTGRTTGQVTSLSPEHTGRTGEVNDILGSASRDELLRVASERGVDTSGRVTSRELAERVAATGGLPEDEKGGPGMMNAVRPSVSRGRGKGAGGTPPGIARLRLGSDDPRPDAPDDESPGFLFF